MLHIYNHNQGMGNNKSQEIKLQENKQVLKEYILKLNTPVPKYNIIKKDFNAFVQSNHYALSLISQFIGCSFKIKKFFSLVLNELKQKIKIYDEFNEEMPNDNIIINGLIILDNFQINYPIIYHTLKLTYYGFCLFQDYNFIITCIITPPIGIVALCVYVPIKLYIVYKKYTRFPTITTLYDVLYIIT